LPVTDCLLIILLFLTSRTTPLPPSRCFIKSPTFIDYLQSIRVVWSVPTIAGVVCPKDFNTRRVVPVGDTSHNSIQVVKRFVLHQVAYCDKTTVFCLLSTHFITQSSSICRRASIKRLTTHTPNILAAYKVIVKKNLTAIAINISLPSLLF